MISLNVTNHLSNLKLFYVNNSQLYVLYQYLLGWNNLTRTWSTSFSSRTKALSLETGAIELLFLLLTHLTLTIPNVLLFYWDGLHRTYSKWFRVLQLVLQRYLKMPTSLHNIHRLICHLSHLNHRLLRHLRNIQMFNHWKILQLLCPMLLACSQWAILTRCKLVLEYRNN